MPVTSTTRMKQTRWSAGGDVVTRTQFDQDAADLEGLAAGFIRDTWANLPAAGPDNVGFIFEATDLAGAKWWSDGVQWMPLDLRQASDFTPGTVVNTTTEGILVFHTLLAALTQPGDVWRFVIVGDLQSPGGIDFTFRVKLGATTIHSKTLTPSASGSLRQWRVDSTMWIDSETAEAMSTLMTIVGAPSAGWQRLDDGTNPELSLLGYGVATENLTSDQDLAFTVQMSAANPSALVHFYRASFWRMPA